MMATRLKQFGLLLFSMLICGVAFFQMFERTTGGFPQNYLWMLAFVGALFLTSWGLPLRFQPYANQAIMCCVMVLTGTGIMMIARIDQDSNTSVAFKQLLWLSIALVLANLLVIFMKDYRVLRRFSYVSMVIGLVLLLSPMLPVIGSEQYGARIWVKIPGLGSFQPSEFAKLFLAFFFASYLYDHRDQLAVGGKKVLGLQLPRIKDLGPIIVVWIVSMGVLVVQHDLGTSLMFFAMFVSMLYVATGRTSWIVIGFIAFAVGAFAAANIFSHVGARVDAWLHPFDSAQYNKEYGGSYQLVTGIFGLASGGLMGTGLGFTMAFQVFTVVGGITLVIPLTGLTLPYMAAGGSSLIANYMLAALLVVISNSANKPESDIDSDTFQYEAMQALRARKQSRARRSVASAQSQASTQASTQASAQSQATEIISTETPVSGTPVVPPAPPSGTPNVSDSMSEGSQA